MKDSRISRRCYIAEFRNMEKMEKLKIQIGIGKNYFKITSFSFEEENNPKHDVKQFSETEEQPAEQAENAFVEWLHEY